MGRETVMTAVTWKEGKFPVWTPVSGKMSGWAMPATQKDIKGSGCESPCYFVSLNMLTDNRQSVHHRG